MTTDPIADFLTRIRNAVHARHDKVIVPKSKLIAEVVRILQKEGFVGDVSENPAKVGSLLSIQLRYVDRERPVISGLTRISKPGLRIYKKADDLPRVLRGLGVAVISTSRGLMTDRDARKARIGGEVLCYVW